MPLYSKRALAMVCTDSPATQTSRGPRSQGQPVRRSTMGKARARRFSQAGRLHPRRQPRVTRDRTSRLRRCAVLWHHRQTALAPPRHSPQRRRLLPPKQQQQRWQRDLTSAVRPRRSLAGARLALARRPSRRCPQPRQISGMGSSGRRRRLAPRPQRSLQRRGRSARRWRSHQPSCRCSHFARSRAVLATF